MANTENSHGDNNHNTEHTQGDSWPPRRVLSTKVGGQSLPNIIPSLDVSLRSYPVRQRGHRQLPLGNRHLLTFDNSERAIQWGRLIVPIAPTYMEHLQAHGGNEHRSSLAYKREIEQHGPPPGSLAAVQYNSASINAANAASSPPVPAPAPAFSYSGRTKPPAKKRKAPVESTDVPATKKTKVSVDSTDALATKDPNSGKPWTKEASKRLLDHKVRGGVWEIVGNLLGRSNQSCRLRMLTFSKATGFSAKVTQEEQDALYAELKNWEKELADEFAQAYKAAPKKEPKPKSRRKKSPEDGAAAQQTVVSSESVEPTRTTRHDSHQPDASNTPVGGLGNEQPNSASPPPSLTGLTPRTMSDVTEACRSELARSRNLEGFRSQESYESFLPDHEYSKKSPPKESNTAAASPSDSDSENNTSAEVNAAEALLSLSGSEVNNAASTPATSVTEEDQTKEA